jgi:hypothetical protein
MLSYQMFSYVTLDSVIKKKTVNTIQSNLYYFGEGFDFSIYFLNYQSIIIQVTLNCVYNFFFLITESNLTKETSDMITR